MKCAILYVTTLLTMSIGFGAAPKGKEKAPTIAPPNPPKREFRAAWVAAISNLDWPSKPTLSVPQQKAELIGVLDKVVALKLNAIILQIRPACDAIYASRLEPWSECLTGKMGRAPEPFYDPLAFAVEEAHRRGLELHAWFNPFRARLLSSRSPVASNHISRTQPKIVRTYDKYLWLDPAEPAAQRHSMAVILDVVKRYDIDGVHLDDYFYPYKATNKLGQRLDFPDDVTWKKYVNQGGKLPRGDWRRKNVDDFVQNLSRGIKAEKSWVKFGISPFGIWRPGHPKEVTGLDAYDELHADSRKWLASGWVDYFVPQLYWPIDSKGQSYGALLKWWAEQNTKHRHLWSGISSAKAGTEWSAKEIVNQIALARKQTGVTGHVHWSVSSLVHNGGGLADALAREVYAEPALVPPSPWMDDQPPRQPILEIQKDSKLKQMLVTWKPANGETVWLWVVQTRLGQNWTTKIVPREITALALGENSGAPLPDYVAVTAIDRSGNPSPAAVVKTKPTLPG